MRVDRSHDQQRSKHATAAITEWMRREIQVTLCAAGFADVTVHILDLEPPGYGARKVCQPP